MLTKFGVSISRKGLTWTLNHRTVGTLFQGPNYKKGEAKWYCQGWRGVFQEVCGRSQETWNPVLVLVGFEFRNTRVHAKKCLTMSQWEVPGSGCLHS